MQPDSVLSINAVEGYPLEDFSEEAVRSQIAEAQKIASGSGSEQDIAEAKIELEVRVLQPGHETATNIKPGSRVVASCYEIDRSTRSCTCMQSIAKATLQSIARKEASTGMEFIFWSGTSLYLAITSLGRHYLSVFDSFELEPKQLLHHVVPNHIYTRLQHLPRSSNITAVIDISSCD